MGITARDRRRYSRPGWENDTHLCPRRGWQGGQKIIHTTDELPQVQSHILGEQGGTDVALVIGKICSPEAAL